MPAEPADLVVLLDEDGSPCGTAPRATVHTSDTPLHLAFSCYVFDDADRLLLTRRAVTKRTWPGVWTNSFCGHPRPGEETTEAIRRYGLHELGLTVADPVSLVPSFRYRAVDAGGIVENEVCPVYAVRVDAEPVLNAEEAAESRWVELSELHAAVAAAPWALSPWLLEQVAAIEAAGGWPVIDR
ncbi:isopentenyl-diphosphate Delta-isomerase [Nocardioides sp. URHA0020]|uniref:isopentenyl-diphosphate Delta-isomerase n=1 Tax=Nocardioides sp. URHA0020 TaxID=1380392 RepID=UPI00048BBB2A|nr:isopentenyl-diphosphate Delta-isomerase [Nocardioides sp. URHA0020]